MDKNKECLDFLRSHETGVIATVSKAGVPNAATVTYSVSDDFEIYFMTRIETRKYVNLEHNPVAAFVVGTGPAATSVQIEGSVKQLDDEAAFKQLVTTLTNNSTVYSVFIKMNGVKFRFFKLTPMWVRMFNLGEGDGEERFTQII